MAFSKNVIVVVLFRGENKYTRWERMYVLCILEVEIVVSQESVKPVLKIVQGYEYSKHFTFSSVVELRHENWNDFFLHLVTVVILDSKLSHQSVKKKKLQRLLWVNLNGWFCTFSFDCYTTRKNSLNMWNGKNFGKGMICAKEISHTSRH